MMDPMDRTRPPERGIVERATSLELGDRVLVPGQVVGLLPDLVQVRLTDDATAWVPRVGALRLLGPDAF
jgi:hypothetical protein